MPGNPQYMIPIQKGQILNPYGCKGKPENREAIEKKRLMKKILTDALKAELDRVIDPSTGFTVKDRLIRTIIQNAERGNDRLVKEIFDRVEGSVKQTTDITSNDQQLGVVIVPSLDYTVEE